MSDVKLKREQVSFEDGYESQVANLQVTAVEASGDVPVEIFLFQRREPSSPNDVSSDVFLTVCSPVDLEDYPAGAPDPSDPDKRYRSNQVTLLCRSSETAETLYYEIVKRTQQLTAAVDRLDDLGDVSTEWVSDIPLPS